MNLLTTFRARNCIKPVSRVGLFSLEVKVICDRVIACEKVSVFFCFAFGKQDVNGCEHRVGKSARNVLNFKLPPAPGPFG